MIIRQMEEDFNLQVLTRVFHRQCSSEGFPPPLEGESEILFSKLQDCPEPHRVKELQFADG
jgi:hypothetical protein